MHVKYLSTIQYRSNTWNAWNPYTRTQSLYQDTHLPATLCPTCIGKLTIIVTLLPGISGGDKA